MATAQQIQHNIDRLRALHVPVKLSSLSIGRRLLIAARRDYGSMEVSYTGQHCKQCGIASPSPCMVIKTIDAIEGTASEADD